MTDRLYNPNPTAIEVRVMPQGGSGKPEFVWATFPVTASAGVLPMRSGDGCTIARNLGETLLCSNSYEDVSEALVGDAKRFPSIEEVEELILASVQLDEPSEDEAEDGEAEEAIDGDELDYFDNGGDR